jgi:hypothetical protein
LVTVNTTADPSVADALLIEKLGSGAAQSPFVSTVMFERLSALS